MLAFQWASLSKKYKLRAVLACAESKFLNWKFEYLCENEFLSETILTSLSGAQMGWINDIQKMLENLVTLPL